jgi:hypothetical protein
MRRKREEARPLKAQGASVRASISFPPDLYGTLEEIAKQKKVSLAWVVRDAAEKYVAGAASPSAPPVKAKRER